MRLYLGVAQDIVVKRTIDRNENIRVAGNVFSREVVIKYEIENHKDKPVTLEVIEDLRFIRREVRGGDGSRDAFNVDWQEGKDTTLGAPDKEKSTADRRVYHVQLPAQQKDGKAEKIAHKLAGMAQTQLLPLHGPIQSGVSDNPAAIDGIVDRLLVARLLHRVIVK